MILRPRRRHIAAAMGVAAFLLVMLITSGNGPGLDPDAMGYIGAATSFAHHGTFRVPSNSWDEEDSTSALTTWPPGFSVAMAIPQFLGAGPMLSAQIVLASSAFVTSFILFILIETGGGAIAAAGGVAAVFVTPAIIGVHWSALSEPLFLACLLLTLLAMVQRPRNPIVAGIPAAAAAIVRYAGVCAPAAVVLWFFLTGRDGFRQRLADAVRAAVVPVIVLGAWVVRSALISDGQGGVDFAVYGKLGPTLRQGLETLRDWVTPGIESPSASEILSIVMAGLIAIIIVAGWRRVRGASRSLAAGRGVSGVAARERTADDRAAYASRFLEADALLLGCYLAVLVSARIFVGDAIPFDFRLLAPAILLLEAALAVLLSFFLASAGVRIRAAALVVIALWFAGSISVSAQDASDAVANGEDFASTDWRTSPTIEWIRTRSQGWTLFTNWPAAVYFHTNRNAHDIPQSLDTADLNEFGATLRERHGAFVVFSSYNTDYAPPDSIARRLGLVEQAHFSDGEVWVSPGSGSK
jgi:hypothetical protein